MILRYRLFYYYLTVLLTIGLGGIDTISAVSQPAHRIAAIEVIVPHSFTVLSRGVVLTFGFFLLIVAYGLWQRSRQAWRAAIVLATLSLIGHLIKGPDVDEAIYSSLTITALWLTRAYYTKPTDVPTLRRAIATVVVSFVTLFLYGMVGFFFLRERHFGISFNLEGSIVHVYRLIFFFGDPSLTPLTLFSKVFLVTIYLAALFTWCFGAYLLLQPALERLYRQPLEHGLALELVRRYGSDHTDYFKLYWDKRYFFTKEQDGFLAYKLAEPNALVLADPVAADAAAKQEVVRQFLAHARHLGWRVAFQNVPESSVGLYQEVGWQKLKIGEEAMVDLAALDLERPEYKQFRTALRRVAKDGHVIRRYDPPLAGELLIRLRRCSDEWLSLPNRVERIFSQGCFDSKELRNCPVATLEDEKGRVLAFISLVEGYGDKTLALDLLRREKGIPNGAIDALLMQTMLDAKGRGLQWFSLGLAPLAGVGTGKQGATLPERTLHALYENYSGFSYRGLREFKDKFCPVWRPRYLVFERSIQLPSIGLAILQVSKLRLLPSARLGKAHAQRRAAA